MKFLPLAINVCSGIVLDAMQMVVQYFKYKLATPPIIISQANVTDAILGLRDTVYVNYVHYNLHTEFEKKCYKLRIALIVYQ